LNLKNIISGDFILDDKYVRIIIKINIHIHFSISRLF